MGYIKNRFDHTSFGIALDGTGVCPLSQQQTDGAKNDGLSGTRLTRDNGETSVEIHVEMFNQRVVFYMQMTYH
jgi:hypothetical protein